jgi:hypothetical protein
MRSESKSQLPIPIKGSKLEPYYKIKRNLNLKKEEIKIRPLSRSFFFIFSQIFASSILIGFLALYFLYYDKLPQNVPLFFIQSSKSFLPTPKDNLLIFPLLEFFMQIIIFRLDRSILQTDRRLVFIVNVIFIVGNILLLAALLELFGLIMVY